MLDMSFSEIAVIGVVALVVLGPERLPKVARTAGHLFGRLQRYVATVKADINREMDTSELAKIKQEVQDAAKSFEQSVQQHASTVEKETAAISQNVELAATPANVVAEPASTQSTMLLDQENGLYEPAAAPVVAEIPAPRSIMSPTRDSNDPVHAGQASLDFGIEPVRALKSV